MSAQHTPGPWFVSKKNPLRVIESGPRALTLATASTTGRGVTTADALREANANARLIAAAPELLESMERALLCLSQGDSLGATKALRAAIAKATGSAS